MYWYIICVYKCIPGKCVGIVIILLFVLLCMSVCELSAMYKKLRINGCVNVFVMYLLFICIGIYILMVYIGLCLISCVSIAYGRLCMLMVILLV